MRACRAGFNNIDHPFDVLKSNEFIRHQTNDYKSALDKDVQNALENDTESVKKYEIIQDPYRRYIPFNLNHEMLNSAKEMKLLKQRIGDLESQVEWYEKNYGHQSKWFTRLGKVIHLLTKRFKS